MEPKQAAGLIIYRLQKTPEFLLLQDTYSQKKHWTPPKGYVLASEDDLKCALREANELTGLTSRDLRVEPDFSREIKYLSDSKLKRVVYFLAQISDYGRVVPADEGIQHAWLPPQIALERAMYRNMQDVLKAALETIERSVAQRQRPNNSPIPNNLPPSELDFRNPFWVGTRDTVAGFNSGGSLKGDSITKPRYDGFRDRSDRLDRSDERRNISAATSFRQPLSDSVANERPSRDSVVNATNAAENPLYKTKLCERFQRDGQCPYGHKCTFAHGASDLRERPAGALGNEVESKPTGPSAAQNANPLFKTRMCERLLSEGVCQYGERCYFAHSEAELKQRPNTMTNTQNGQSTLPYHPSSERRYGQQRKDDGHEHNGNGTQLAAAGRRHTYWDNNQTEPPSKDLTSAKTRNLLPQQDSGNDDRFKETGEPVRKAGAYKPPHVKKPDDSVSLSDLRGALNDRDSRRSEPVEARSNDERSSRRVGDKGTTGKVLETIEKDLKAYFAETHTANEELREVTKIEAKHDLPKQQLFTVLVPALFHGENIAPKIKVRAPLLKRFVLNQADQTLLLRSFDRYYSRDEDALATQILYITKALYETDLVEEEAFLLWADATAADSSPFRQKIKPFIDWLKTADEED